MQGREIGVRHRAGRRFLARFVVVAEPSVKAEAGRKSQACRNLVLE